MGLGSVSTLTTLSLPAYLRFVHALGHQLARVAPRRPEVHQHQHLLLKIALVHSDHFASNFHIGILNPNPPSLTNPANSAIPCCSGAQQRHSSHPTKLFVPSLDLPVYRCFATSQSRVGASVLPKSKALCACNCRKKKLGRMSTEICFVANLKRICLPHCHTKRSLMETSRADSLVQPKLRLDLACASSSLILL